MQISSSVELFSHTDYRLALKERADAWKKAVPTATFQALALACRVQKAYLSRVLQQKADLSHDQIYLACDYLGLAGLEREFMLVLHDYGRSDLEHRRFDLLARLEQIRLQGRETLGHLQIAPADAATEAQLAPLFLDPDAQLVLMFLTVERFRRQPSAVAEVLSFKPAKLERLLEKLRQLRLITATADGLQVTNPAIHLKADSELFQPYRALLRQRMLAEQLCRDRASGAYSFCLLFTATKQTEGLIRDRLLALLKEAELLIKDAPSEEVFYLGLDLVQWSSTD